jgi:polyisoprenoid-binding protein YceI
VRRRSIPGPLLGRRATTRTVLSFAAVLLAAQEPPREVRSANGRFLARISPTAEVEIAETAGSKPPKRATVQGLKVGPALDWRLADDGAALVAIAPPSSSLPLVQLVRDGSLVLAADAAKLELAPAKGEDAWLGVRLRSVVREGATARKLDLLALDGRVRTIDLQSGEVRVSSAQPDAGAPRVEPGAESGEPMFVTEWFSPDAVFAGEPLAVHVRGSLPTPAWKLDGFSVRGGGERALVLAPLGSVKPGESISLQVLKGYEETAMVHGLAPGLHRMSVQGRGADASPKDPPRSVRVLPVGTRVFVARTGGFAGGSESVALLEDGSVRRPDRSGATKTFLADDDAAAAIVKSLAPLPTSPSSRRTPNAADLFEYEIVRTIDGRPLRLVRDDPTLEPGLKALVDAMFALEAPAPTPAPAAPGSTATPGASGAPATSGATRYDVDVFKSTIEVRTGSSGILSTFGHDHRLMVQRLSGRVDREAAPEAWTVALEVDTGSLAVVDDESQKDRPEIEKEMNAKVLESARFPKILFNARRVGEGAVAEEERKVDVDGELDLHGRKKPVRVPVTLTLHADTLRARGKVRLKLSDFSIERTSAAGGTVKVADEIDVFFDVIATRSTR